MRRRLLLVLPMLAVCSCFALGAGAVPAQEHGDYDTEGAYYSPRLKAQFRMEQFFLPQFGSFVAARIVSEPDFDSPLRQIGLRLGDVITRLDRIRVLNLGELDRHYDRTIVRYFKTGTQTPREGQMFIDVGGGINPPGGGANVP